MGNSIEYLASRQEEEVVLSTRWLTQCPSMARSAVTRFLFKCSPLAGQDELWISGPPFLNRDEWVAYIKLALSPVHLAPSWHTDYSDWGFSWFSRGPPPRSDLQLCQNHAFPDPSNSLFTIIYVSMDATLSVLLAASLNRRQIKKKMLSLSTSNIQLIEKVKANVSLSLFLIN